MLDVLNAVYDFIYAYSKNENVPQFTENQIIRGWQNSAVLPQESQDFCVFSEINTIRHGTNEESLIIDNNVIFYETLEHVIQIDFYSLNPFIARSRANLIELLAFTRVATDFFKKINKSLTCLYAEDVRNLTGLDETKSFLARYQVVIHLEERLNQAIQTDYFTNVNLHLENVDVHHKI